MYQGKSCNKKMLKTLTLDKKRCTENNFLAQRKRDDHAFGAHWQLVLPRLWSRIRNEGLGGDCTVDGLKK